MEVHAHAHLASGEKRKKFKHYLWEFLMLFLAVFCGFLAENFREHQVEHERLNQYIRSLYNDLKNDTAFQRDFKEYLLSTDKTLDTIINMISNGQYLTDVNVFYRFSIESRSIEYFEYHNSTFEQLKNSGNLRLLRSYGLADSITSYNNVVQALINNQEARFKLATSNAAAGLWDIIDARYFKKQPSHDGSEIPRGYLPENALIENADKQKLLKFKNLCFEKRLIIPPYWHFVSDLNKSASNILLLIKEKYHPE